jgi:hypothetical protein
MIGNDVIDILAARKQSNWKRPGFLQKLFTANEQEIIHNYHDPEVMVWALWSMKEAAYKIYNRETSIRSFIPHLLECSINTKLLSGIVTTGNFRYYTKTVIDDLMIHTVAVKNFNLFSKISELQEDTVLKDDDNLPYIITSGFQATPISISHHGRFKKVVFLRLMKSLLQ